MKQQIIFIFIISLILGGCGDFLEPKSKSEFVPKDANSMNELLLGEAYPRNDVSGLNIFLYLLDDDVAPAPYQEPNTGSNANAWWAPYSWQSNMYEVMETAGLTTLNIYKSYYTLILGANAVLDYIVDINDDVNTINSVKAQALALRGYFYFNLVNIFGAPYNSDKMALGVPLKLNSGIEESELKRNTVEEVYSQILDDLLEAERLYQSLPTDQQWQANWRTSLPMVQLLLSRVYLYMEQWEKAATYANNVIQNGNFRLLDLKTIDFNPDSPSYINYHSYTNSPEVIWVYGNMNDFTNYVYNASSGKENRPFFRASEELMKSFDETAGDLRKDRYIIRSSYEITNANNEVEAMPSAFGKVNVSSSRYYQPRGGTGIFSRSFRLSEAYLNFCEANAMLNKAGNANAGTEALRLLNELRTYRFPSDYQEKNISDPDELITFIHDERRRELCFEDHRWFDLRRWGMKEIKHTWFPDATSTIVYTLQENDPGYTLPLPPDALELNNLLEQNPLAPSPRNGSLTSN
ncbi:RagB/SusD family nutrient uptake outer membrane protein [Butyricimonas sp.]|uniref:RagB/SusD family nutrient uptake outer membrane protein n=1 Tax=Butyricimonas sp. TaxID=1969738 RepID=UPI001B1B44C9|nr:RagB/SusD family nutrient uptake outer membrane protein [Butyricimonas sp.]MBO4960088.1 RagB/SusD family nutrient uptake outer membrane protein [Butyricimonas sp.]